MFGCITEFFDDSSRNEQNQFLRIRVEVGVGVTLEVRVRVRVRVRIMVRVRVRIRIGVRIGVRFEDSSRNKCNQFLNNGGNVVVLTA